MGDRHYSIPAPRKPAPAKTRVMIDAFGGGEFIIETKRGKVVFEWSDMFGPIPIAKNRGQPRDLVPSHPFWRAASLWNLQGRRTDGKRAVWHEPRKPVYETKHLGGRHYLITKIIDEGEIGHDW